jgi:hypothetical protein
MAVFHSDRSDAKVCQFTIDRVTVRDPIVTVVTLRASSWRESLGPSYGYAIDTLPPHGTATSWSRPCDPIFTT